ncbi:GDP-mannose transporter [Hyaloraphidium curvatum]|nr:GDP-mannose transporter [Hyaloraphidium curvatum]
MAKQLEAGEVTPRAEGAPPAFSRVHRATAVLAFCASSTLMLLANKFVLSKYHFTANFLLLAIQHGTVLVLLEVFCALGLASHRPFRPAEARQWMPVALCLVGMIYSSMKALAVLSIPLYTVLKNGNTIAIAYSERAFLNGSPVTPLAMVAFSMIVTSSLVAGWGDLSRTGGLREGAEAHKLEGYFWMAVNIATSASYSVSMRATLKFMKLKDADVVLYNNMLAVPLLFLCSLVLEREQWATLTFCDLSPEVFNARSVAWAVTVSAISCFGISYCTSWSVRVNSSAVTSMAGALNKLPISILGMVAFGEPVTTTGVTSVMLGFFAGLVYVKAKTDEAKRNASGASADKG